MVWQRECVKSRKVFLKPISFLVGVCMRDMQLKNGVWKSPCTINSCTNEHSFEPRYMQKPTEVWVDIDSPSTRYHLAQWIQPIINNTTNPTNCGYINCSLLYSVSTNLLKTDIKLLALKLLDLFKKVVHCFIFQFPKIAADPKDMLYILLEAQQLYFSDVQVSKLDG